MKGKTKKNSPAAIKGTKDILPSEVRKWQKAEVMAKQLFELYGYREIRTPVFEGTELFQKGTGPTSDIVTKEMYTFVDKGGRSLTLRPEYTPSVARAIIEHRLYLQPEPLRFYFIGPMFRYDKPQKGRYRQFHQINVEVFDEKDPAIDAEIVEMAQGLLHNLKVSPTIVLVNSVGCQECRPQYQEQLRVEAQEKKELLCSDCQRKIGTNPLRIFDCKVESCREVSQNFPQINDYLCSACRNHFNKFCSYLELFGLNYKVQPRLVRGLDYYTKTTFEIISPRLGAQDALLGGGRYDDLMKVYGGPDICGLGFAVGMERLLSIVPYHKKEHRFLYIVHLGEKAKPVAMELARNLRKKGVECLLEYKKRNLKNQMSRANKLGATWTVIIGEEEVESRKYSLKNMKTGKQETVDIEEILKKVKNSSF